MRHRKKEGFKEPPLNGTTEGLAVSIAGSALTRQAAFDFWMPLHRGQAPPRTARLALFLPLTRRPRARRPPSTRSSQAKAPESFLCCHGQDCSHTLCVLRRVLAAEAPLRVRDLQSRPRSDLARRLRRGVPLWPRREISAGSSLDKMCLLCRPPKAGHSTGRPGLGASDVAAKDAQAWSGAVSLLVLSQRQSEGGQRTRRPGGLLVAADFVATGMHPVLLRARSGTFGDQLISALCLDRALRSSARSL